MDADALATIVCPRCGRSVLENGSDGFRCLGCGAVFPLVGGIPCLVPDPGLYRSGWHSRTNEYFSAVDGRLREINSERDGENVPRRTRERLLRVMGALHSQRRMVETLMAPLNASSAQLPSAAFPPIPGMAAPLAVLHHYENIFRDWAWGEAETSRQRELVQQMVTPFEAIRNLAVYGSGAGRLAVDLHEHLAPAHTFALDTNPLPLIVADQLIRGVTVELPEFPIAPRAEDKVVVLHRLEAATPRPGTMFMFADALRPPLAAGSVDVVVTPWFIDVLGVDLTFTAAAINRVLRPGGLWLNLGPLLFKGAVADQHAIEEVLDIVGESGFQLITNGSEDVTYFRSPYTGSSRVENVFWFSARKTGEAAPGQTTGDRATEPPWVSDPSLPVPLLPQLAQIHRSSVFTIGVLSMVDGRRSIAEMSAQLARSWNAEPAAVQDHLRAFFGTLSG